ncbi:MAG: hypothetical protein LBQ46_10465, partial [Treponema sp.]|nr:hypothetical protein [Treponema sp.]
MAIKFLFKLALPVLVLAGCTFLMGPDEPVGENTGTLTVSFGEAAGDRAISSGKDLPSEILAALRYEVSFTGPGNTVIHRTVSGGGTVNLALIQGLWRIDALAYYGEDLLGTGSLSFDLIHENTLVRVPMYMSGPLYEIIIPPTTGGTVASNFSIVFPGTTVTLTVTPQDPYYRLTGGSLKYNGTVNIDEGTKTFAMPASDVTIRADFSPLAVGGPGPAGGLIFYDKGDDTGGWRYLECAPADMSSAEWGAYMAAVGGTDTAVGTGQANTAAILAKLSELPETGKAAQLCDTYTAGGYDD